MTPSVKEVLSGYCPARGFLKNPAAYHPHSHFNLVIGSSCNAYVAPLGLIQAGARDDASEISWTLNVNHSDVLRNAGGGPISHQTSSKGDECLC